MEDEQKKEWKKPEVVDLDAEATKTGGGGYLVDGSNTTTATAASS